MASYYIKRGGFTIAEVKPRGTQHKAIMTEDRVVMNFKLPNAVKFKKGDVVEVFGQKYKLNQPNLIKRSKDVDGYTYSVEFEALYYDLGKWFLNTLDQNNNLTQKDVFLMSTAEVILKLIVDNANQIDAGWSLGTIDETEVMQHTFSSFKLLTVLHDLAGKYNNEFWFSGVDGKTINFCKQQDESGISLTFGAGNGLYEIVRDKSDKAYFNRLTIQGGTQNLPENYGFQRLQMPVANRPFLEANTDGFDVVEEDITLDNIYPSRIGTISSVGGSLEVFDTSLDFDINDHLTPDDAKIAFVSGQLAGFTFSINNYDHSTKKISFNLIDDDPAYPIGVPNVFLKAAAGDKYVLLDIYLPQTFVDAAEAKILAIGQELLLQATSEEYKYGVSLTPKWVVENSPNIVVGNLIHIHYSPMEVDENLRILGFDRDLQETYKYGLEVGVSATVSPLVKEATKQSTINNAVTSSGLSAQNKVGVDTLDAVAKRGRKTSQILEARGLLASEVLSIPTARPSSSEVKQGAVYLYMESVPEIPPTSHVVAYFGDLLNVDETGKQDGYVTYWDAAAGRIKFKPAGSVNPGDLSNYHTKSEISAIFAGGTPATGYNKSNWDSAFTNSHTHSNKAFLDTIVNGATLPLNISGNAASASNSTAWNSYLIDLADYGTDLTFFLGFEFLTGKFRPFSATQVATKLGNYGNWITQAQADVLYPSLTGYNKSNWDSAFANSHTHANKAFLDTIVNGATLPLNISGNANYWGGRPAYLDGVNNNLEYALGRNPDGTVRLVEAIGFKNWLGLSSDSLGYHRRIASWGYGTIDADTVEENTSSFTYAINAPYAGYLGHFGNGGYGLQMNTNYNGGSNLSFRTRNGESGIWNGWQRVLMESEASVTSAPNLLLKRASNGYAYAMSFVTDDWFRSNGSTGWYNQTHFGGIYMIDAQYIRTYGGKEFLCDNNIISTVKVEAPTIKATSKLLIPTTRPTVAAGEVALYWGEI